jgi:hypothetical protein
MAENAEFGRECRKGVVLALRGQPFGGYFQWVLDAACEPVEWPYQPLGFDSLVLRPALDLRI